jgi:hypothetical protein
MTLTQNQRKYRQRRDDAQKDFRRTTKDDGSHGRRVTRKAICCRVSQEANERLNHWAQHWGKTRWEMITHLITHGLPRYLSHREGVNHLSPYCWDEKLLNPETRTVRYKGTKGSVQVNERITSTAWKTLECHSTAIGQSKARILQRLILGYQPVPQSVLEANREYRERGKQWNEEWKQGMHRVELKPLTPEERADLEARQAQLERESEERWQRLMGEAVARYQHQD